MAFLKIKINLVFMHSQSPSGLNSVLQRKDAYYEKCAIPGVCYGISLV